MLNFKPTFFDIKYLRDFSLCYVILYTNGEQIMFRLVLKLQMVKNVLTIRDTKNVGDYKIVLRF